MTKSEVIPLVSIGMPVYNGEKTIRDALDALLAQDFKDFELIISDNASTDDTGNICKMYAARDRRVRYDRNLVNIGPTANFNRVLHLARGKYFMWAADDDLWEPSYVSCMEEALNNNPDAVLSFCRFDFILSHKPPAIYKDDLSQIIGRDSFFRLLHTFNLKPRIANSYYIYGLIRKDVLLKCGGMETRVDAYRGSDSVTLFHLLYYGQFIKVDKLLYHRGHNSDRCLPSKEPLAQRLAKQSLYSLFTECLKWLITWHQRYHILRVIVKETSLHAPQKIILLIRLYIEELLFHINNKFVVLIVIQALWIKMQDTGLNMIKRLTLDLKRM